MIYTRHGRAQIQTNNYRTIDECHHTIVKHYRRTPYINLIGTKLDNNIPSSVGDGRKQPYLKTCGKERITKHSSDARVSKPGAEPDMDDDTDTDAVDYSNIDVSTGGDMYNDDGDVDEETGGGGDEPACLGYVTRDPPRTNDSHTCKYGYERYLRDKGVIKTEMSRVDYQNRTSERRYFVDTAHYLYDYYQQRNGISRASGNVDSPDLYVPRVETGCRRKPNILSYVSKTPPVPPPRTVDPQDGGESNRLFNPKKTDEIASTSYRKCVDPDMHAVGINVVSKVDEGTCDFCGALDIVTSEVDSTLQCRTCGTCVFIPILQATPSFKKARTTRPNMTVYKRINHFNDWLSQFQAKENMTVPPDVYNKITHENSKSYGSSRRRITQSGLRKTLRKLGLTKYYEHIPHIIQHLQGTKPPKLTRGMEERMRVMFKMIQDPFTKHSSDSRKNFLSYSFVLRKFVGLLRRPDLKKSFPLLKSRTKLYQQDVVWRKICKQLNWRFEPSI